MPNSRCQISASVSRLFSSCGRYPKLVRSDTWMRDKLTPRYPSTFYFGKTEFQRMVRFVSDDVLAVWSSSDKNGVRNFEFGIETQTWGFKDLHPDYQKPFRWILFGFSQSKPGGPRTQPGVWRMGTADLLLCEVASPLYVGHGPHWPDEVEANAVIYPHRIGMTVVGSAAGVSTGVDGPLGLEGSEALRLSGINRHGVHFRRDITGLRLEIAGSAPPSGVTDLSQTAGAFVPDRPGPRRGAGQGRSQDPALNAALEKHAVEMAIDLYRRLQWDDIRTLGKPYDLVCTKVTGEEKHVEVKGTTGAGGDVIYTPNEVHHFRHCPHGADLVVVRDIQVDRTTSPYTTSGGELLHKTGYGAPPEDLTATGWTGRVTGW